MSSTTITELKDALGLGLGIVSRVWEFRTKDWVTSVFAADIDNNGEAEVITCSRDGRVHLLTTGEGACRWERVVGAKVWVGTGVVSGFSTEAIYSDARIIVGTRDGKVYIFDKDGKTLTRDGTALPFDKDGKTIDTKAEEEAFWYKSDYVIRQVCIDPEETSTIIIGSEDRSAYGVDYKTGEPKWKFPTNGWARAIFSYDINGDGRSETLVGSVDRHFYVLDSQGQLLAKYDMKYPIHTIFAADIDSDGCVEMLIGTDGKDLTALTLNEAMEFKEKWRHSFDNRLLCLCVADIDGDKKSEIIAGSEDKHFYILDAQGRVIWRHNHKYRVFSIHPYDIDKDGLPELLVGSDNNVVRAMRIRLRRGLDKKIRRYHRALGGPDPNNISELTLNERELLQDILGEDQKEHVTLKLAKVLISAMQYKDALAILLQLEQQKAQRLWNKNSLGHLHTVCFRHVSGDHKREIIVGASDGNVYAYNSIGKHLWSIHLSDRIVDMQTGYLDRHKQEEIVICSSNHQLNIVSGTRKRELRNVYIDSVMSSLSVKAPDKQGQAEIIIGSEDTKLSIYGSDLTVPIETISIKEGVRIVRTCSPSEDQKMEIVVGSLKNQVYAYTRDGKLLWEYKTHDHIRDICLTDMNGDGNLEVIIGSEDRNVHILDSNGHLLWRYRLPHSALSVAAADANHDNKVEIFVGCADGFLYVFNREGEFLWKYQAKDRIHAVHVEDIDEDGNVEIAIGSEDEFELLQVVNQRIIRSLIDQCWSALCQDKDTSQVIKEHLDDTNPFVQTFALGKLADQTSFSVQDFNVLEQFAKESPLEVRKTLIRVVLDHYQLSPERARRILQLLSIDSEEDIRITFVEYLPTFMQFDWEAGILYLKRFSESTNRYVRRLVVRKLHQLIDTPLEVAANKNREIFDMLLDALNDQESEWVRQEAARSMSHYLSSYHGGLIIYIHLFIVKNIQVSLLEHIAYATNANVVKNYLNAVIPLLSDISEENMAERTQQVVRALDEASALLYGRDLHLLYAELYRLLSIFTINEIAVYQPALNASQFPSHNEFARIMLNVFEKLSLISRTLKIYLMRVNVHDRLSSLLETITAIEKVRVYLEQQYSAYIFGEPISKLPDHYIFAFVLRKWRRFVNDQLNQLRGKPELKAELQSRYTLYESQVGIWLIVSNRGRSSASNVKITLLYSEYFETEGARTFETEVILPQEEITREFIIKPHATVLDLQFEVVYDDVEGATKIEVFGDRLELWESRREFRSIPNPYSTGTPTHDIRMFYGREADMAFLEGNLTRDAKTVIVLYGQRRSGKTTMLIQLINSFPPESHITVFIDMQRMSYHMTIHNFLYKVAHTIAHAMKRKNIVVSLPEMAEFKVEPTFTFDTFLDEVQEQLGSRKLILMIDEFEVLEEQVNKGKLEPEIFEYLRDILQHRQNINFLFSGTHKITEYTKWYSSVFFNIARHYRLSRLSSQGAEALIQKPVEGFLEYEPLTVKKVRQLTADQPYLIHLICRAIIDYCNERCKSYVTINDVNGIIREVMETGQFHFDWLWSQLAPVDRVTLATLAEGEREEGRWHSLIEIEELLRRNAIPFTSERLMSSLQLLIEADLIENLSGNRTESTGESLRFRIPVGLVREWLSKEKPLELVRKELM